MNCNQTTHLPQFSKSPDCRDPGSVLCCLKEPKGISILSHRMPIPVLSPLQSCRGTPMKLINFSPSLAKNSQKIIRKLIAKNAANRVLLDKQKPVYRLDKGNSLGNQALNDLEKLKQKKVELEPFKVHRYARPRLLRAMKRDEYEFDRKVEVSFNVPSCRSGFLGKKKVSAAFLSNPKQRSVSPSNFYLQLP